MTRFAVPILALAVLAGAGVFIFGQVRDLWPDLVEAMRRPTPAPSPAPTPTVTVDSKAPGHRSAIVIEQEGGRLVVALSRTRTLPTSESFMTRGLLGQEIFRQALLIAARDGLGAVVRDEMLGESAPASAGGPKLELHYTIARDSQIRFSLRRAGEKGEILWSNNFGLPSRIALPLGEVIEKLEPLTRGGLLDALKAQCDGPARVVTPAGPEVPAGVEDALGRLTFASQFSAVRALAQASPPGDTSAVRLGALARGYANLGVLTEHHWNASHKAFEARALLYSQRLVSLHPDAPASYWHRAYARGLIGMHREALTDLEEAEKRIGTLPANRRPTPPPWVELVKDLCEFDTKALLAASSDPTRAPLASMLALMTVEHSQAISLAIQVAQFAREVAPDNLWVNDASARIRKLGHLHVATVEGLEQFDRAFRPQLKEVAGLPDRVARLVNQAAGEVEVAKELDASGALGVDSVEPSWSVLGRMVREARFPKVARRVEFMATMWSVPVHEVIEQFRPLVSGHPYWPLLQSYAMDTRNDGGATLARLRGLPIDELEETEHLLVQTLQRMGAPDWMDTAVAQNAHSDSVERDRAAAIRFSDPSNLTMQARALFLVSPYSPIAVANLIEHDWDKFLEIVPDFEKDHTQHPEVLVALGKRRAAQKKMEEAERLFSAAIKISPDQETYAALAAAYKALGKMDRWKETLDAFLAEEDPGLDHARVQVELARYFMGRREYDKALPYAESAAQTWAGWAMQCAAECHELMGDWEKAELWYSRMTERYSNSRMTWFFFCARTGHGDRDSAAEYMERYISAAGDAASPDDLNHFGAYYILTKQPRLALELYKRRFEATGNPAEDDPRLYVGIHLALLADELGDTGLRDRTLDQIVKTQAQRAPGMTRICQLIRDWLVAPQPATLDLKPIDEILDPMPAAGRGNFGYFVGRFLELHGRPKEAMKYYGYGARIPETWFLMQYLATNALRDLGVKVGPEGDL